MDKDMPIAKTTTRNKIIININKNKNSDKTIR